MAYDTNDYEAEEIESTERVAVTADADTAESIAADAYTKRVARIAKDREPLPKIELHQKLPEQTGLNSVDRAQEARERFARQEQIEKAADSVMDALKTGNIGQLQKILQTYGDNQGMMRSIVNTVNERLTDTYQRLRHTMALTRLNVGYGPNGVVLTVFQADSESKSSPYNMLRLTTAKTPTALHFEFAPQPVISSIDPAQAIRNVHKHAIGTSKPRG